MEVVDLVYICPGFSCFDLVVVKVEEVYHGRRLGEAQDASGFPWHTARLRTDGRDFLFTSTNNLPIKRPFVSIDPIPAQNDRVVLLQCQKTFLFPDLPGIQRQIPFLRVHRGNALEAALPCLATRSSLETKIHPQRTTPRNDGRGNTEDHGIDRDRSRIRDRRK